MDNSHINKVVIVGGGTAGWMTAAALSRTLKKINITLIESESIGTIGVGEATIPTLAFFNGLLGISPDKFVQSTQGTFKLGINFENWKQTGHEYFHGFGTTGRSLWAAGFHDFWRRGLDTGDANNFSVYNQEAVAAKAGKFVASKDGLNHAYHLDAGLYAKVLRELAESLGVQRLEGKVTNVTTNEKSGFIESVTTDNHGIIEGDLFIDCSGFRGLLINETLETRFIDWSHYLPCDRAIAVQTESVGEPIPYTRSIAHHAGWQWRIPLQHRTGNGIVYASDYMSDDEAQALLLSTIDGAPLTEPRPITFKTGYREQLWNKNCVAIGLAGGFIEPLESTAIHLIQQGIIRLIKLFPTDGICQLDIDEYNLSGKTDYEQIKDFIVLHYHVTERDDSPFWQYCRTMAIPESLQQRLTLFKQTGRFIQRGEELFVDSWLQVMIGQGLLPDKYHRIVDEMSQQELAHFLNNTQQAIKSKVNQMPSHKAFIDQFCSATR